MKDKITCFDFGSCEIPIAIDNNKEFYSIIKITEEDILTVLYGLRSTYYDAKTKRGKRIFNHTTTLIELMKEERNINGVVYSPIRYERKKTRQSQKVEHLKRVGQCVFGG